MEKIHYNQLPLFQQNEILESKRKELLGNLASDQYAGYNEMFGGNTKKLIENLKSQGIKVKKMGLLLDIRSKITGIKMYGLGIGPLIGIGKDAKDVESTVTHEAIHVKQYRENAPKDFLKARLGFIKFGIQEQGKIMKNLKKERQKYGTRAARRNSINNSPMEYEAYFHEGDTGYLETRKPFAYKQYETKEGRSEAVRQSMEQDILHRLNKANELINKIDIKENISKEDVDVINILVDELLEDVDKIYQIKQEYGKGDWELISTFKTPKGPMVRLESEKNKDIRLGILEKLLAKEHACVDELKKNKNSKIISSQAEMDENGIIKIQAKDSDIASLFNALESNPVLKNMDAHIVYGESKKHIRISFTG